MQKNYPHRTSLKLCQRIARCNGARMLCRDATKKLVFLELVGMRETRRAKDRLSIALSAAAPQHARLRFAARIISRRGAAGARHNCEISDSDSKASSTFYDNGARNAIRLV